MKTLKVEGVYPLEFETAEDVADQFPAFIEKYNSRRPPLIAWLPQPRTVREERGGRCSFRRGTRRSH